MDKLVGFIEYRGVDELSSFCRVHLPVAAVNMPEDVQRRFELHVCLGQFFTAQMRSDRVRLIESSKGWTMRHQNVRVLRNYLPVTPDGRAASDVKGPVIEGRLNG